MVAKDSNKTKGSTKAEVGEIDTSAPFQSVKDAVNLFGEGAFSGEKPAIKKTKAQSAERVLAKETQLHLAQKELNKLKEKLTNAEATKSQALLELDRAKKTVEDLTQKLKSLNESKDSAIKTTEAAKQFTEANNPTKSNGYSNLDIETARAQYMAVVTELDAAKQELRKIRQEYDATMEAKYVAVKQEAEAENSAKMNGEKVGSLSKEIASIHDSVQQVKLESMQAKEEETKICAEKDRQKMSYKAKLEESLNKLLALKNEVDPKLIKDLETQLCGISSEIEALQNEMESKRANDLDSSNIVSLELDNAKDSLNKVRDEEKSLQSLVETLKVEVDNVKKEHSELKEKEAETESIAGDLHVKLRKAKSELEEALVEEAKVRGASDEMIATIHQLAMELENAKQEAEETKLQAENLKIESETIRLKLEEAEKKLKVATQEAEEAKAAEAQALGQIKTLTKKTNTASHASTSENGSHITTSENGTHITTSENGTHITISKDEYESLSRKVGENEKLAGMKVEAALAQVEAVKAGENEALKRLEATQKEIEEMKNATKEALRKAEMAEAARKAVEGELRRWRETEQKKAAEVASRILEEASRKSFQSSPYSYQVEKTRPQEKGVEIRKLEKAKTSVAKKVLMPSLSGVFHKKKSHVESG